MALQTAVLCTPIPLDQIQRVLKTSRKYLNLPGTGSSVVLACDWVDPLPYRWR